MSDKKDKLQYIASELGSEYYIDRIDFEDVIVKDINSNFQFEISFINATKSKLNTNIYVWQVNKEFKIVEQKNNIKSMTELKIILNSLSEKYQLLTVSNLK